MTACLCFCYSVAVSYCSPLRGDTLVFSFLAGVFWQGLVVLVVNFYSDLCVSKVVVVRRSDRDEMEYGWKDVLQSAFHVCQHRQFSEWVCDADGTSLRVTRQTQRR